MKTSLLALSLCLGLLGCAAHRPFTVKVLRPDYRGFTQVRFYNHGSMVIRSTYPPHSPDMQQDIDRWKQSGAMVR